MRKVTITLEEDIARWARVRAAELDTSVSRLVGLMLRERMLAERGYEAAACRYLARKTVSLSTGAYPERDDLHDR